MTPTTVLVTGAFGQVGRRLTTLLLDRGRTVVALDVRNETTEATAATLVPVHGSPGTLVTAFVDLLDAESVRTLVAEHRPEVIVHLAAILAPTCYRNPAMARRVNVEGTTNLVEAAKALAEPPTFIECSSSAVYGSRNPFRHADRLTADTPVNPIDCYGEDKVASERIVTGSGLPHATLRLGGVMSPDMIQGPSDPIVARAVPRDNRIHMVDARDVALAFANAVDRTESIAGKTLMIAGDESCVKRQQEMMDDLMEAMGIGRLGPSASLPGDPDNDQGWFLTDWFDTSEAQALLDFQQHTWQETADDLAASMGRRRVVLRAIGPVLRPVLRLSAAIHRRRAGLTTYVNPWAVIAEAYGPGALAGRDWRPSDLGGSSD